MCAAAPSAVYYFSRDDTRRVFFRIRNDGFSATGNRARPGAAQFIGRWDSFAVVEFMSMADESRRSARAGANSRLPSGQRSGRPLRIQAVARQSGPGGVVELRSNRAVLQAIESHLPEARVTNDALAEQFPEWTPARIHEIVGVDDGMSRRATELHVGPRGRGGHEAILASGCASPADIDYVIHCTQGPDYFLPTTACVIQNRLGLPRHCGAVDINLGCSGYVYGLGLAKGLIESETGDPVLFSYSGHVQQSSSTRADRRAFRSVLADEARRPHA